MSDTFYLSQFCDAKLIHRVPDTSCICTIVKIEYPNYADFLFYAETYDSGPITLWFSKNTFKDSVVSYSFIKSKNPHLSDGRGSVEIMLVLQNWLGLKCIGHPCYIIDSNGMTYFDNSSDESKDTQDYIY